MAEELVAEADLGGEAARKLLGELAYRSGELEGLKRTFGLGEALATTLVGLATRIAAKMTAYAFLINRTLGRPQGRIKSCGHEPSNTHLVVVEGRGFSPCTLAYFAPL